MKLSHFILAITALASFVFAQGQSAGQAGLADSLERKVAHLRANGARERPDRRPTVLTDAEVDAYMNSGRLKVPAGISDIHLVTSAGIATGSARVDFDLLLEKRRSMNPLWMLFTGVHDVKVRARTFGRNGVAEVHVESVHFDGREVPRRALEFFIDRFLRPKVPQAGLDASFKMPVRIHSAIVGEGRTTLVQR